MHKGFLQKSPCFANCCFYILLLLLCACNTLPSQPAVSSADTAASQQYSTKFIAPEFNTDVPLLKSQHLQLEYWLAKTTTPDQVLLSSNEIQHFNQRLISILPEVIDVLAEPAIYRIDEVRTMILALSHPSDQPRFNQTGIALTEQDWQHYEKLLGLPQLPSAVTAQFALVTSRGDLRTFPTDEGVYSSSTDQHLDRFQESAVFPGEALQVLHLSADAQWAFVRHYHYQGWLAVKHFATAEKSVVEQFIKAADFIVVTGVQVKTNFNTVQPLASQVILEMGVKLPRVRQHPPLVNGQNASFSYVVQLPVRQPTGQLQLVNALIARHQDITEHYLPLTKANILRQAFKFLGEHYGWGHDLYARDCSGFIGEVYRSFGFILPRNTGTQGQPSFGSFLQIADSSAQQKHLALQQAQTGDLIFIPGHVMLVLGQDRGETFMIHDVAGLHYYRADGSLYHSMLNGVSITPLSPLQRNEQQSYIDGIYLLKSLTREFYANPAN